MKKVFMISLAENDLYGNIKPIGNAYFVDVENYGGLFEDKLKCKPFIDDMGGINNFRKFVRYCEDILYHMQDFYDKEREKKLIEEKEKILEQAKEAMEEVINKKEQQRKELRDEIRARITLADYKERKLKKKVEELDLVKMELAQEREDLKRRKIDLARQEINTEKRQIISKDVYQFEKLGCVDIFGPDMSYVFIQRSETNDLLSNLNISPQVRKFITRINKPIFERDVDNPNTKSFDFIRILIGIRQYIGESRSKFIRDHIEEIHKIAIGDITHCRESKKYKFNTDDLKMTEGCITEQDELMLLYELK